MRGNSYQTFLWLFVVKQGDKTVTYQVLGDNMKDACAVLVTNLNDRFKIQVEDLDIVKMEKITAVWGMR